MAIKEHIDWSGIATPGEGLDFLNNSIRKGIEYDAYGDRVRFYALALTDAWPLSAGAAKSLRTGQEISWSGSKESSASPHFVFKGRILGDNSPHEFLPDPCDPATAVNTNTTLKVIEMHTTFTSDAQSSTYDGNVVKAGDIVLVQLAKNAFSYDLQFGSFIQIVEPGMMQLAVPGGCSSLQSSFAQAEFETIEYTQGAAAAAMEGEKCAADGTKGTPQPPPTITGIEISPENHTKFNAGVGTGPPNEANFKHMYADDKIITDKTGDRSQVLKYAWMWLSPFLPAGTRWNSGYRSQKSQDSIIRSYAKKERARPGTTKIIKLASPATFPTNLVGVDAAVERKESDPGLFVSADVAYLNAACIALKAINYKIARSMTRSLAGGHGHAAGMAMDLSMGSPLSNVCKIASAITYAAQQLGDNITVRPFGTGANYTSIIEYTNGQGVVHVEIDYAKNPYDKDGKTLSADYLSAIRTIYTQNGKSSQLPTG
jgi:hypothetical protein